MRKPFILCATLLLLAAFGCHESSSEATAGGAQAKANAPRNVRTEQVTVQPFRKTIDTTGTVAFDQNRSTQVLRSEEHTSELQSLAYLVCRLLLEKKN